MSRAAIWKDSGTNLLVNADALYVPEASRRRTRELVVISRDFR